MVLDERDHDADERVSLEVVTVPPELPLQAAPTSTRGCAWLRA